MDLPSLLQLLYHNVSRKPLAVITGASAGVGCATAIQFAQAGYKVGLISRSGEGLAGAQADV
jgi:short-subunit dehydrogenase